MVWLYSDRADQYGQTLRWAEMDRRAGEQIYKSNRTTERKATAQYTDY